MERPNVLFVVFDTARADAFEPFGAAPGATPTMAQLASSGTAFTEAYSPTNWTVPGHAALLGGLLPRSTVVGRGEHNQPAKIKAAMADLAPRLLPSVLSAQGYATSGLSTNAWVSPATGFDTGFDSFELVEGDRLEAMAGTGVRDRAAWALQALRARADDGARAVERTLVRRLAERDDRPFFWFVNLVECHTPYLPPKPYDDLGPLQRLQASEDCRNHQTFAAATRTCLLREPVPKDALARMRHLYGRAIRLLDDWLARVLEALDRAGLLDETIVLVASDHGENLGEDGLIGHGFSLDDRLLRVPLVVSGPWKPRADDVTSLARVPRLLAGALDIDDHPWQEPLPDGIAVAQMDAPCEPDDPIGPESLDALGIPQTALPQLVRSYSCATDGRLKLFREGGDESIIELDDDPLELARVPLGQVHRMRHGDALTRLRTALDVAEAQEVDAGFGRGALSIDDPELAAKMRLLGYL